MANLIPFSLLALLAFTTTSANAALVPSTTTLKYHKGPLLTQPIHVYVLWYGSFTPVHKATITTFISSLSSTTPTLHPSVSTWWKTTQAYKDAAGRPVSSTVRVAGELTDEACSLGTTITRADILRLVGMAVTKGSFTYSPGAVYFVLTASDIKVERFCMGSCGFHTTTTVSAGKTAVVAHVGDPGTACPGLCSWPFATPAYGPPGPPLVAPNGVGVDGMVMNIATVIAGASTNPLGNGHFQGDALAPLEAVTACPGIFGNGAYPGFPGNLMVDPKSKASFNAYGNGGRRYLLPAMWDPVSGTCKALS